MTKREFTERAKQAQTNEIKSDLIRLLNDISNHGLLGQANRLDRIIGCLEHWQNTE